MSRPKLYRCDECLQIFRGRPTYDYHVRAHKHVAPVRQKVIAPKRASGYTAIDGNTPADIEGV